MAGMPGRGVISRSEAEGVIRDLLAGVRVGDRRHLLMLAGEGRSSTSKSASALARCVDEAIDRGTLVFLRGWNRHVDAAATDGPGAAEVSPVQRLIDRTMGSAAEIAFEGRQIRLIPAGSWRRFRSADTFEVVRPDQAKAVCERIASRRAVADDQQAAWLEAASILGVQGPRVIDSEGILLIRQVIRQVAFPRTDAPLVTPSQLKKQAPVATLDWIEVVVLDDDDRPFRGRLRLELPGGRQVETTPDEEGIARFDEIPPGDCKLTFVDLDPLDFSPSA